MPVSNLGRIGFVPKGDWIAGAFKYLDVVRHNKSTWICAVPTTTAEPGSNADWQNALTAPSVTGIDNWAELSGEQTPPLIAYDDGDYWGLAQAVTDIAMSKPSEGNDNWRKLGAKTPTSNPGIIGVKMQVQGGNGGRWLSIDDSGSEIATPSTNWFNAHPVWGGIVEQIIDGQHMVKIPKFYYKRGTAGGSAAWWISDQPANGFTVFPAFVLDSVEKDQFWYGKYQASESGGKLQSIAGVLPKVNISLTNSLTAATARNVGGVEGFRLHHYDMWLAIQWLYLVENATMDSQTKTGQGRVSASSTANVDASDVAEATYRGMAGLWGNVYQWIDGVRTTPASKIERRAYTGSWADTGETVPNRGSATYPTTFRTTSPDSFIPDTFETGNTNATLPDYVRWGRGDYYPYVGGTWNQAANAGLWNVYCISAASNALTDLGARLARIV